MRNIIFILGLLLFCTKAFPQFYRPFPEGEAVWTIASIHLNYCPGDQHYETQYNSYIIQIGDTQINSNVYHKIYREPFLRPAGGLAYPYSDTGYVGALRQNISLRQVYIFLRSDSMERLLYDFSLDTLGAPFPNTIQRPNDSTKFFLVDTAWLVNGNNFSLGYVYRGYLENECGSFLNYSVTMGIGGSGLYTKAGWFKAPGTVNDSIYERIICMSEDGNLVKQPNNTSIFLDYDSLLCVTSLTASFTELPGGYHLKIKPNPAHDYLTVTYNDLPSGHKYLFTAYNLLGQQVIINELHSAETTIFCRDWSSGMYLWKITNDIGIKIAEGKLVKE